MDFTMSSPPPARHNIYHLTSDFGEIKAMFNPLLNLSSEDESEFILQNQGNEVRKGRYKKRVVVTFEVQTLSQMRIPTQATLNIVNTCFDRIFLYQWQAIPTRFDFFLHHRQVCKVKAYDKAVLEVVVNFLTAKSQLTMYQPWRNVGKFNEQHLITKLLGNTGYQLSHRLIDINLERMSICSVMGSQDSMQGSIVTNSKGKIFDVQEFARGCIKVMENLMLFTSNDLIRQMQLETNANKQSYMLRLLDHRPIIQDLWTETIDFALARPGMEDVASRFTIEQISVLFNCYKQMIYDTFNKYALGNKSHIVQPHPVRALLDHIPFLQVNVCFDLTWYNYRQYGLNMLATSYLIGKNMLADDYSLTSNQGSICMNGRPGSGKSRIAGILHEFMNGFTYQDSSKGITEFQNYDIVSKSFIRAEEVDLKRLCTADWKMLSDIEVGLKCKIKNQQDVEIGKFVSVMITSNGNVFEEIISKIYNDPNVEACHRRWGFIRFFETWNAGHPELFNGMSTIDPLYVQFYSHTNINHELMNTLMGCALTFTTCSFVDQPYIIGYYSHCLVEFSKTLFGLVVLANGPYFQQVVQTMLTAYRSNTDKICCDKQGKQAIEFEKLCQTTVVELLSDDEESIPQLKQFKDTGAPFYYRCLVLCQEQHIKTQIADAGYRKLLEFLTHHSRIGVYEKVLQNIRGIESAERRQFVLADTYQDVLNFEGLDFSMDPFDFVDPVLRDQARNGM